MVDPKTSHFEELKTLMMGQADGDETRAARLTLTWGMLWALDRQTPVEMILDLMELLRFELSRKRAEGEPG